MSDDRKTAVLAFESAGLIHKRTNHRSGRRLKDNNE